MALLPFICSAGRYGLPPGGGSASAAPPANDYIVYVPVRIPEDCTVLRVYWANGGSVSGNVNMGLYSSAGSKLWETGSTAQSGTNQLQFVDIANQATSAGFYYMALQFSSTSARVCRFAPTLFYLQAAGVMEEQAGSFALPATATFAKLANAYLPAFGLDLRGSP